jgi:hypothetical protein
MDLGCGFESRLHLKTRWKYGPLDARKSNKKIKAAKWGMPHQKNKKEVAVTESLSYSRLTAMIIKFHLPS